MRLTGRLRQVDWRSPRTPLAVAMALVVGTGLALATTWFMGARAPLSYDSVPRVEGSVPAEAIGLTERIALFGLDSPASPPPALTGAAADPAAPPLDADLALLEWVDSFALPQVAADGRRPLDVYARLAPRIAENEALIALVVVDLGLDSGRLEQSVLLPNEIGLAHTPYAAHLSAWQRHARFFGHEVYLELPLQPVDYPTSDFGPWALRPGDPPARQITELERVLGRSEAYVGLIAASEAFAREPHRFAPVASALAARGLGLVELGEARLEGEAEAAGLAYLNAIGPLDAVPDADAIDAALGQLEGVALRDGAALGYVQAYPLTFDRLWHWSRTLDSKGIALVPVSYLLARP